jgi:hypothetical protein
MSLLISNPSVSTVPPTPPSTGFTPGTDLGHIPLLSTISMNSHSVSAASLWETNVTSNGSSHLSSPAHSHYSDLCEAPSSGFNKDIWSFVFNGMMVPCLCQPFSYCSTDNKFQNFQPPSTQEDADRMLSNATTRREDIWHRSELARSQHRAAQLEADLHRLKAKDAKRPLKFTDLLISCIWCSITTSNHSEVLPNEAQTVSVDSIPVFPNGGKAFNLHPRPSS